MKKSYNFNYSIIASFLLLFSITISSSQIKAQDSCFDAVPVFCESPHQGSTVGATNDDLPDCGTTNGTGGGVWHTYTAPVDGDYKITTCAAYTNYDTKVRVFTGSCDALVCVGGDDDESIDPLCTHSSLHSMAFVTLVAGEQYSILIHGYNANEGDFELQVVCPLPVIGCMNETACNYDSTAVEDDGSCIFGDWYIPVDLSLPDTPMILSCDPVEGYFFADQECAQQVVDEDNYCVNTDWDGICFNAYIVCLNLSGCTDDTACNYDFLVLNEDESCMYATGCDVCDGEGGILDNPEIGEFCDDENDLTENDIVGDDCECLGTPIIFGCMSEFACNYDSSVTQDDGSCIGDWYIPEGIELPNTPMVLSCEPLEGYYFAYQECAQQVVDGDSYCVETDWDDICLNDYILCLNTGCTDEGACNYDSTSNEDDGSCTYGDWYIPEDLEAGNTPMILSCDPVEGYYFADQECALTTVNNDAYCIDTDWDDLCQEAYSLCLISGCMDETACNYDNTAEESDDSCLYALGCDECDALGGVIDNPDAGESCDDGNEMTENDIIGEDCACLGTLIVFGCTNEFACNYNDEATQDDESCMYATGCDVCDGDGGITDNPEVGESCDDGNVMTENDIVADDCECLGTLIVFGCTDVFACNYNGEATQNDESCVYATGCDICDGEGGVIDNPEVGESCDDGNELTENDIIGDDCNCAGTIPAPENDLCENAEVIACGDLIEGNTSTATIDATLDFCGTTLTSAPGIWYTIIGDGSIITASLCGSTYDCKIGIFEGACDDLICVTGNDDFCGLQSQVDFVSNIETTYFVYVTGFFNYTGDFTLNLTCVDAIPGCMDDFACNYDGNANIFDESCIYPEGCDECDGEGGITDNPEFGESCDDGDAMTENDVVDENCFCAGTLIIFGCTDEVACNYDSEATQDDESCEYENWYIPTDEMADLPMINSCEPMEGYIMANQYCAQGVIESNPECIENWDSECGITYNDCIDVSGCTDETACNYDETALEDDDNCLFATGCDECDGEGGLIDNPDAGESCDDGNEMTENDMIGEDCGCEGTLIIFGCTFEEACNYDSTATQDDESCFFGDWYIPVDFSSEDDPMIQSCEPVEGYFYADQECAQQVADDDSYCIDTEWDDICQDAYDVCVNPMPGCMDDFACNYDENANIFDESCIYPEGCDECDGEGGITDNPEFGESCDDGDAMTENDVVGDDCNCEGTLIIFGCTDEFACNYDSSATQDDESCEYAMWFIPIDETASLPMITSCEPIEGYFMADQYCAENAIEANPECLEIWSASCTIFYNNCIEVSGCTDETACNYDVNAIEDNGSCVIATGCDVCDGEGGLIDNPDAGESCDDGNEMTENDMIGEDCECAGTQIVFGCTNPEACNYDSTATQDDESCMIAGSSCDDGNEMTENDMIGEDCECAGTQIVFGCTNPEACNYDSTATQDDESCMIAGTSCDDGNEMTENDMIGEDCECAGTLIVVLGCTDDSACNFNPEANQDDESCEYETCAGCTDPEASNYNVDATIDDESCEYDCITPVVTYETHCNGENFDSFYITMTVSDIGNGMPYSVTNDQNGDESTLTSVGSMELGPFANNTDVIIIVTSLGDDSCISTSEILTADCIVGIEELSDLDFEIYPNPNTGTFVISLQNYTGNTTIDCYDLTGRNVFHTNTNIQSKSEVSISLDNSIATGVYVVKIETELGVITKQLIIER